ncbi:universal stress protein [Actinomadura sp. 6K520]|uniref:universal stress protein n=1 Tax=Actinomadura sp. 6K520 TaxID=2530364 RepID=UPI00104770BC|nr:universal stress protein [Actinomadura sp. 6K520]TDE33955.1 universal stress protein [Actinomadura sp. 6K520]
MDERPVLVGYDGSPASERAVHWAAAEAALRGAPLSICHAWSWPYPQRPGDRDAMEIVQGMGALTLEDGVRLAREAAPELEVRPVLLKGTSSGALLGAAVDASLIVVGARGAGGFDRLPLGSTAVHVPAHANRPVVVVPARQRAGAVRRIVVGIDGSPASEAALRFALREARLRDASVTLVCAWWDPASLPGPERLPYTDPEAVKEQVRARFTSAVGPQLVDYPDITVEERFVRERAGRALVDGAAGAMLLVVGDRGIGSSPTTLLGAVTRAVLHEAPSPVAVVHEHDQYEHDQYGHEQYEHDQSEDVQDRQVKESS